MQMSDMTKFSHYMFTQHNLGVGEGIYGLGERFTAFNKVGQQVSLYNSDGGTSSEQAYKNISFYLSSFGYGVFIDHTEPLDLEIGSERTSRLQTSVKGQKLKWYLIYGPHPKAVLRKYLHITGHPGVVPLGAMGFGYLPLSPQITMNLPSLISSTVWQSALFQSMYSTTIVFGYENSIGAISYSRPPTSPTLLAC
jgi:alpha-glucosidase (family GH31 glycosyl hydrolase)